MTVRHRRKSRPDAGLGWIVLAGTCLMVLAAAASSDARPVGIGASSAAVDTVTRRYEVRLWMTGYTGLIQTRDCAAITDPAGYDSLIGVVQGIEETRGSSDPVVYTGTLRRKTRIDYCLAHEPGWCVARLTGEARMTVEIEVHEDSGAGAWMKATPVGPADTVTVQGSCSTAEHDEIRQDYPGGESGGTPDGQPIEESNANLFTQGGVRRLRVGVFPPNAVQGGWGLRVIRVLP